MTAYPVEQQQTAPVERVLAELESVAAEHQQDTRTVAPPQGPQDAADVQAMSPEERRAWFAATSGKQRWEVVGRKDQPRPPADPQYAARAACRGTSADLVELRSQAEGQPHAEAMCAQCPVFAWCAEDARDFPAHGLWAGVVLDGHKVAPGQRDGGSRADRADRINAWLADQLATHGPMTQARLLAAAKPHRFGIKSLREAADTLGVLRPPFGHVGPWRLPEVQPEQLDEQVEQPDEQQQPVAKPVHRGQRTQPRRLPRAKRKRNRR